MAAFDANKAEAELNQYWYSEHTIATMVKEIEMFATKAAFLSTPSLYFALTNDKLRENSKIFEFDRQWEADPGFVFYDFNAPEKIPVSLWDSFDYIVVDPPFITAEVWAKYAETIKLIAKKGAKLFFTSVIENHQMLEEFADTALMVPVFRPSIPKLVYQYHCFTSYESHQLGEANHELPPEDDTTLNARRLANDMRESQNAFKMQAQCRPREGEVPLPTAQHQHGAAADPAMQWTHVPDGWTEYPEGHAAAPPAEVPPSAEFLAVEQRRAKMTDLRALVEETVKAAEGAIKPYAVLAAAASSDEKKAEAQAKVASQEAAKAAGIAKIETTVAELHKLEPKPADLAVCHLMEKFIADWREPMTEKGAYMEKCADATRLYKSPIFNRQKELLAEMKAIKKKDKEAAAAATTA